MRARVPSAFQSQGPITGKAQRSGGRGGEVRRYVGLGILMLSLMGCDKDKPKAEETKAAEPTPVPSGLVFNDFLPTTGNATGLGVRDAGLDSGLAAVTGGDTSEPATAEAATATAGKLKITEPGAEPRAPRKYTFTANKTDKRVLTITQSVSQSSGGQSAPPQEVTLKLYLDLTPKQVKQTAAMMEAKLAKVELPGAPPAAAQMLAGLTGLAGTFEVSARGDVGEVQFSGGSQMKNQMAESVLQGLSQAVQLLYAPLPDGAIGVGAKWELVAPAEQSEQGSKKFTLKELNGDSGVVDAEIEIKVPRRAQPSRGGGMMFVEVDGKGKYSYQLKLSQVATKVEGDLTLNEKIEVADPRGGGKQTIVQSQKAKHLIEVAK